MQLDSSIDQRLNELEEINREIQQHRDVADQEEQMTQQNYYQTLGLKMEKSKVIYQTVAAQTQQKAYNEIATGRFRNSFQNEDEARGALESMRGKNLMIEEVLNRIKNENPDLDAILSRCIGWWWRIAQYQMVNLLLKRYNYKARMFVNELRLS